MPAILRIFLYQTDASLSLLGLCGSYDQVGVRRVGSDPTVPDGQTEPAVWNNMPCLTVCVRIGPPGLLTVCLIGLVRCLVYCPTILVLLVWLSRMVTVGNGLQ